MGYTKKTDKYALQKFAFLTVNQWKSETDYEIKNKYRVNASKTLNFQYISAQLGKVHQLKIFCSTPPCRIKVE